MNKIASERVIRDCGTYHIKEASPKDVEDLRKIYKEKLFENPADSVGKKLVLVAIDKKTNQLIGGIERDVDLKTGYAQGIGFAVSLKHQGVGVGANLLQAIDEELKNMGVKHITTLPSSERSWKIFDANGYRYVAAIDAWLKQTGQHKFVKAAMEKEL